MPRFAFTFLLFLFVAGCHSAVHTPQPTIVAQSPKPAAAAKQFWDKTARFFQPLMPDMGKRSTESENHAAARRSHSEILPINHTPHSLYQAGSIFPSPILAPQNQERNVSNAETANTETTNTASVKPNPLQIQAGDSEVFKSLLREIAIMPADQRKVDDTKLAEMLTSFRNEIMDSDVEAEYLALLRKRILPESAAPRSAAPLPEAELAVLKRSPKNLVKNRELESEYDDEDRYDEQTRHIARRTQQSRNIPIAAQEPAPTAAPVYPSLTQLSVAAPATVQTSYQTPSLPSPASHISSYGAGDWQAPTRQAIEQLRYAIEQTPNGKTLSNEMRLRLLEMLLGNKAEAARSMHTADETFNRFMGHQVLGFATLLDDSIPDSRGRHISAAYRFNEGLMELQTLCPMKLKNVVLIKNWFGYGQFVPHTGEFHPGDDMFIYVEIENPTVRRIPDGFETGVAISYEIRDAGAKSIVKQDVGTPMERTLSRKRDYCMGIGPILLPASLAPGQYQLRLSLTDLNNDSMQYAEEQIPFRIVPSLASEK